MTDADSVPRRLLSNIYQLQEDIGGYAAMFTVFFGVAILGNLFAHVRLRFPSGNFLGGAFYFWEFSSSVRRLNPRMHTIFKRHAHVLAIVALSFALAFLMSRRFPI